MVNMLLSKDEQNGEVVIFGAGNIARAFIISLRETIGLHALNLVGCMVSNIYVNAKDIEGVPVYSIDYMSKYHREAKVLIAVKNEYMKSIENLLIQHGMMHYRGVDLDECIQVMEVEWKKNTKKAALFEHSFEEGNFSKEEYLMFLEKQLKRNVLSFEVNFVNHCNLNCQCCNHFSPLAKASFLDKYKYASDLKRIHELFGNRIGRLMLLGGEPLLHPEIEELLQITRDNLPDASLYLITNGLLFSKMSQNFWRLCNNLRIGIKVTKYPLKFDYAKWERYALEHGVDLSDESTEPIKTTYRLPLKENGGLDPYRNYMKCYHANMCVVLREGRLYTCPIAAWVDILNEYYSKKFPQLEDNSIDIYQVNNPQEIEDYLKLPIPMCSHCDIFNYKYNIPWSQSKKSAEEWLD